jgi:hypothetical protein
MDQLRHSADAPDAQLGSVDSSLCGDPVQSQRVSLPASEAGAGPSGNCVGVGIDFDPSRSPQRFSHHAITGDDRMHAIPVRFDDREIALVAVSDGSP